MGFAKPDRLPLFTFLFCNDRLDDAGRHSPKDEIKRVDSDKVYEQKNRGVNKMNIRTGISWTKLVIAIGLLCAVFGFSVTAQNNPNQTLDEESVAELVEELANELADLIEDEDQVAAITEKWESREDLEGKTRTQILGLLFADVKSVVRDAETQKNIWDTWTGAARTETEEEEADEDWSTMDNSRKLNAQNVSWMLEDLQDELSDYIENQAQVAAIVKKWRARKDLVGKTKADVTALLYADVKSIVKDKETLDNIEDSWKVSDEAECRKNGGSELRCFESTYYGMAGYGIFGKQADERVHVDKKSVDLMNRWIKERLEQYQFNSKFECVKTETSSCGSLKPKQ